MMVLLDYFRFLAFRLGLLGLVFFCGLVLRLDLLSSYHE